MRVRTATLLLGMVLVVVLTWDGNADAQSWRPLKNQPKFSASTPLLLTDGTIMVHDTGTPKWWRLTPDTYGSYVKGTWSQVASLPAGYGPLYYASAVLPDGRLIVEGGEENLSQAKWTNLGAIYDPKTNTWTSVDPPSGWSSIGDAASAVLPNGVFVLANCCSLQAAFLDPKTLTWTETGRGKMDSNNEEGWTLLPNGKVLTIDTNNPSNPANSELYAPHSGAWSSAGNTIVKLDYGNEIGPAILRPNGTVFATGATGHTSIYEWKTGIWRAGPDLPDVTGQGQLDVGDGPACLLPSGNVLIAASTGNPPIHFFEFDGKRFVREPATPNSSNEPSFVGNMLLLPTGQVLFTDFSSDIEIYTPAGRYQSDWKPVITSAPTQVRPQKSYVISGIGFNGMSQAVAYGDDEQAATNYPLVRITNLATGHVFYSRTHDHSSMAVASKNFVFTHFDVPANQERGKSSLVVVANGIPSNPVLVDVQY